MDVSIAGLRVLREIAERRTFTAAAAELGYTQSGVSRQIAALEREAGAQLVERGRTGAQLTPAGLGLLRHARVVLDELTAAERELTGDARTPVEVRVGTYLSATATLLPAALAELRRRHPDIRAVTRDGTTPGMLRAVRAGTLDLAVISARPPYGPPDDELPRLVVRTLREGDLLVAAPATGRFAGRDRVHVDELAGAEWVASPSSGGEPGLGVWPALPGRPVIAHVTRDWLAKLQLVAAGCGLTTVPESVAPLLPDGVRTLRVDGGTVQRRRTLLVRGPGPAAPAVAATSRVLVETLTAG